MSNRNNNDDDGSFTLSWQWLREQAGQAIRNYFAPLKYWRHILVALLLMATAIIPVRDWWIDGVSVMDFTNMMIYMMWAMLSFVFFPMMILLFGQLYPVIRKYSLAALIGSWLSFGCGMYMITQSPMYSDEDGVVIVDGSTQTVAPQQTDGYRFPIWDEREFRTVTNAYGTTSTTVHTPCGDTICATTYSVDYAFSDEFILANAGNGIDYAPIMQVALIRAANIEANTTPDTIAPAVCAQVKHSLGIDAAAACPVTLTFSAAVETL